MCIEGFPKHNGLSAVNLCMSGARLTFAITCWPVFHYTCDIFQGKLRCVEFHQTSQVLLAAGMDQRINLFQVHVGFTAMDCILKSLHILHV